MKNMNHNTLFEFLDKCKNAYHTVDLISEKLTEAGFSELSESQTWILSEGGKYFIIRGGSSIIAFVNKGFGFAVTASHSDQPAFKIKSDEKGNPYSKLLTEKYGGMIYHTWLDRPLAISGRVVIKTNHGIKSELVSLDETVVIPSVAIHLDRGVNESLKLNPAQDLLPLSAISDSLSLTDLISKKLGIAKNNIISHDLYLSSAEKPMLAGFDTGLVLSPRIDDIACVSASLEAFISSCSSPSNMTPVLAVFDNEEVGSETKQGAASTFLHDTLRRISSDEESYLRRLSLGFMVSADNAHALHPNHPELSDKTNSPILGGGVVIKHNANQRYATDAISEALFSILAEKAAASVQHYFNRADMPGGSTLGSISDTRVSVSTVDIGIPQLAMHSIVETCALSDYFALESVIRTFYTSSIKKDGDNISVE